MNKKLFINFLQNLALLLLSVTAVLLLMRFPVLDGTPGGGMRGLLSAPESAVQKTADLSSSITAVHFAVTDDYAYGRYTKINASTDEGDFRKIAPLFGAAMGSATAAKTATETEFRIALKSPGIYIDLTTVLPLPVVAAWLGESFPRESNVRALALTTAKETAMLYFLREDGSLLRYDSALTSSAVQAVTATFAPNGGQFAYESEHTTLAPYTILVQDIGAVAQVNAAIPGGYSAYNLLTALDFNAHTYARYIESDGTEVVIQSPHMLRIGPDGTVRYSSDGEVTDELYRIACAGELPTAAEALYGACVLAQTLSSGTDAAALSLDAVEKTETGWSISFCYRVNGVRVRLSGERTALQLTIAGDTITKFEYYCRAYTPGEENGVLMPPSMAAAVAAIREGAEPALAYVDNGAAAISAHWVAQ